MKALVLFSGGIDSTTALGLAIKKYGKDQVIALSVSYGQKHDKEIRATLHTSWQLPNIMAWSICS